MTPNEHKRFACWLSTSHGKLRHLKTFMCFLINRCFKRTGIPEPHGQRRQLFILFYLLTTVLTVIIFNVCLEPADNKSTTIWMESGATRPSPRAPLCAWSPAPPGTAGCPRPRSGGGWQRWQHGRPELSRLPAARTACGPGPTGRQHTGPDESVDRLRGPPCLPRTGSDLWVCLSSGSGPRWHSISKRCSHLVVILNNACANLSDGSQKWTFSGLHVDCYPVFLGPLSSNLPYLANQGVQIPFLYILWRIFITFNPNVNPNLAQTSPHYPKVRDGSSF